MLALSKLWLDNNAGGFDKVLLLAELGLFSDEATVGGSCPPGYEKIQVKARSQFSTTYHVKRGGCIRVNFYLVGNSDEELDVRINNLIHKSAPLMLLC